ncbi:MAG: hypothetical protein ABJL44_14420 [Algibacter sp.]
MKKLVLVFAGLLIGLTTVSATALKTPIQKNTVKKSKNYRYAQPIVFVERGVEFLIFHDGSFDFNTNHHNKTYNNTHSKYKKSRRSNVNTTYGSQYRNTKSGGALISRDRNGKVKRIGNVYLNYDRYGKITRAGSVYMNYSRGHHGDLKQVGSLHVNYNHSGKIVKTRGKVNKYNDYKQKDKSRNQYSYYYYRHNDDRNNYYKKNGNIKK